MASSKSRGMGAVPISINEGDGLRHQHWQSRPAAMPSLVASAAPRVAGSAPDPIGPRRRCIALIAEAVTITRAGPVFD
jgi:hypothetical protein